MVVKPAAALLALSLTVALARPARAESAESPFAKADSPWAIKPIDVALQAAFTAVVMTDWLQTNYIADHPRQFYESNPILGPHPSRQTVSVLLPLAIVAHAGVSAALPAPYRNVWQATWIGLEACAVGINFGGGVSLSF